MSTASHADRHRQGHHAFNEGDMETLQEIIAAETVWHWPGQNPLAGDHEGRERVFELFQKMAELTGGDFEVEGLAYMSNGSYSAAFTQATATRGGETFTFRGCEVSKWEDGQVVEEWNFVEDQRAFDKFWS